MVVDFLSHCMFVSLYSGGVLLTSISAHILAGRHSLSGFMAVFTDDSWVSLVQGQLYVRFLLYIHAQHGKLGPTLPFQVTKNPSPYNIYISGQESSASFPNCIIFSSLLWFRAPIFWHLEFLFTVFFVAYFTHRSYILGMERRGYLCHFNLPTQSII